jgi:hypothetical protein
MDMQSHLRVKIKSLAAEAAIIRREEKRAKRQARRRLDHQQDAQSAWSEFKSLEAHRKREVRSEQRCSLLAYGFLRGKPRIDIERPASELRKGELEKAIGIANRFGAQGKETSDAFKAWWDGKPVASIAEVATNAAPSPR